jgi:hypothetical protein
MQSSSLRSGALHLEPLLDDGHGRARIEET